MALNGFALGGAADGINAARQLNIQQHNSDQNYDLGMRRLMLEQQSQQNQQKRFDTSRMDAVLSQASKDLFDSVKQAKTAGASDADILKKFSPWIDQLKQTYKKAGLDPATAVDVPLNSTLAGTPSFNIASLIQDSSNQYDVPQDQLTNAIRTESGGNPNAVNKKSGATGIAQFTPGTAASRGVNARDPNSAVPGMASYVSDLKKQFNGNLGLAWAAYNWGPGNLQTWIKNGADPAKMPKETQAYVQSVTGKPVEEWLQGQSQAKQPQVDPEQLRQITMAINSPNVDPNIKKVLAERLSRIVNPGSETQVKTLKDEDGNEHLVFVDPVKRTVTDQNGNPYVVPTGDGNTDRAAIADAIVSGKQPPTLTGLYKNSKGVRAELARKGFDLTTAQLEWKAAEKQIQSLNGPQMVRYSGLANSVVNTIDEVNRLAGEMKNSGITALNAAKIQTLINTAGNSPSGQLATRYQAAVNTLKEEFANLANGGYAPTEPAWSLANQQINGNYGVDQLGAGLQEVQRLIRYRLNAIPNFKTLGAGSSNKYIGGGQPADTGGHAAPSGGAVDWQTYFGGAK